MSGTVRIEEVAATLTAVIRSRVPQGELSRVIPACCGEVWAFGKAAQLPKPGRHVALYLNGLIDLECGMEVSAPFTGSDRVVQSKLPAGRVATVTHIGSYARLCDAHDAITSYCAAHGLALAGPSWEVYGHGGGDPAEARTDVYYLLAGPTRE